MHAESAGRFWASVQKGAPDDCWEWQGYRTVSGYGNTSYKGKTGFRTHRLALILSGTEVPQGALVLHSCDNPPCCNPRHLRAGTALDNVRDMHARGRSRHRAKFSDEQVEQIRQASGTLKEIAAAFGASISHVGNIRTGRFRC